MKLCAPKISRAEDWEGTCREHGTGEHDATAAPSAPSLVECVRVRFSAWYVESTSTVNVAVSVSLHRLVPLKVGFEC